MKAIITVACLVVRVHHFLLNKSLCNFQQNIKFFKTFVVYLVVRVIFVLNKSGCDFQQNYKISESNYSSVLGSKDGIFTQKVTSTK